MRSRCTFSSSTQREQLVGVLEGRQTDRLGDR